VAGGSGIKMASLRYLQFDPRRWQIDIPALSAPANREFLFSEVARKAGLDPTQSVALVRLSVSPSRWRQSPFSHGPLRRALVIFPFLCSVNGWFKALGYDVVEFDPISKGWLLPAHTDTMLEGWLQSLLASHFDLLLIQYGKTTALVFR
jgi:hypothetical protein